MRMGGWILVFRSKLFPHFSQSNAFPFWRVEFGGGLDMKANDMITHRGVFDISLIASIASHLSYWADEDVSHFMISQLLSRQRVLKR